MNKEQKNNGLVTLIEIDANQLANSAMIQMLLEEADIPFFLQNELMSQLYVNTVGGIIIQVPNTDVEKARNLLIENGYNL
jgi:hypothetical protein